MNRLQLQISNRCRSLACPDEATRKLLHTLEASDAFPITGGELSIVFVNDAAIADIHKTFMDDPSPTDVITFPANTEMDFAGEIIVSVDHACKRAEELNEPFSRELSLYLIHGWLHLAGYDDRSKSDRRAMRAAEQAAFKIIDQASATADFQLVVQSNCQ